MEIEKLEIRISFNEKKDQVKKNLSSSIQINYLLKNLPNFLGGLVEFFQNVQYF